jgi:hypothetical protein
MGLSNDAAANITSGISKLGDAITKDPFKAASLAMMAGGLLGNKINPPPEEPAYTPTPVDKSIVEKYGKVPALGQIQYQPLTYQGFTGSALPQGLLEQRLQRMRSGLVG